ncbi:phosphate ABC transporter ATP-binding protein PstB [Borrelia sp. HM]|uniref:phosphate ABC transporter ATP-binding protein PstB n=1 Tax=Borrelia sp. HM TaxID=1882662 RepID=UPI001C751CE6|nr:phosphate ABC transporter ATP-binding protein PstB [Borrelia sp. HM]BCR21653.1 Phosphate import ATP-binding protein PstB 3 [Borrelia sp. HM]
MIEDKAIIKTENLNLFYTDFKALSNINISILRNSITALIGPSGCGKSTFLRTLNRMNDLVEGVKIEGKVIYEGKSIYSNNFDVLELRRKIGMVFQTPNPFLMSVYDNISYGPKIHGIKDKRQLDEIVEKSLIKSALWNEVKDKLNKNALSLSGGQQQRLCIARTLAIEPNVILMDEPTSALDPISTGKIEELIINLKESYTIIIVTHNMQQAGRISDRTAFFLNGYIEEESQTDDLFFNPKNIKTEEYITGKFG